MPDLPSLTFFVVPRTTSSGFSSTVDPLVPRNAVVTTNPVISVDGPEPPPAAVAKVVRVKPTTAPKGVNREDLL